MFQANQLGCRSDPGEGFGWETNKMSSFAQRLPWEVSMFDCSASFNGFIVFGLEVGGSVDVRG